MTESEILEQRIAGDAEDGRSLYQLAVLLADERHTSALPDDDDRRLLARIRTLLTRVITLDRKHAKAHALLAHVQTQLDENEQALAMFRLARQRDPKRASVDVHVAHMLALLDRRDEFDREIAALARRQKVSLARHRKEIAATGWKETPDLLLQAFINPGNYFRSELSDEAERVRNALVKGRKQKLARQMDADCAAMQKQLRKEFRPARVPKALRGLSAAAARFGIGDDVCRPHLMKKIPKATRARLVRTADRLATKVQSWLDSFGGDMTPEAAAFMYLYEGIEELRA